ncbi:MAG TPA: hypothetical protein VGH74_20000 [Planctomycetaceae bacterium]|jgi:WD40 repeat protein
MSAFRTTFATILGIVALAGVPILLADHPDWVASFQAQFAARHAPEEPVVVDPGFVRRFNSSVDGRRLLFVARDGGENRWLGLMDVVHRQVWLPIDIVGQQIRAATLSPDGLYALVGTSEGQLAWIDLETRTVEVLSEPLLPALFTMTAISPDQQRIAAATGDGRAFLGNRPHDALTLLMPPGEAPVTNLRFSRDGKRLVAAREAGSVVVWDCVTGNVLQDFPAHRGVVTAAVLTPEGDQVISAGLDGTVRIWDVLSGKEASQAKIARSAVLALDISPDGTVAAWGTIGGSIYLWNPAAGEPEREIDWLAAPVSHVEFSGDGQVLAVSANNMVIRRFEVTTGDELPRLDVAPQARR